MKTLIITGGSSGIGRATADLFASCGYRVYELSRHGQSRDGVVHITCDVSNAASCQVAVAAVIHQVAKIDVLINNAGFGISGAIEFTSTADAKRLMDVNFFGALNMTKSVLPYMRSQHSGKILFTSSVAAILPVPYQALYSASKAAINALALSLQNEVREHGIQVACLLPGDVRTGFTSAREKSLEGNDIYSHLEKAVSVMERDEQYGMSPEKMARILYRMAEYKRPKMFHIGGGLYLLYGLLSKILPVTLVNWIEGKIYQ